MFFKPVLFLFSLSSIVPFSISGPNNSSISYRSSQTNPNEFVLVNPEQVPQLEKTIRYFFSELAEPVNQPIILRSTSANDLQSTIRGICTCARKRIADLAGDCGLTTSVQLYKQNTNDDSLSEDWYSETLLQSAYLVQDLSNVINEASSTYELYVGNGNETSQGNKKNFGFEYLGVVEDASDMSESLAQCLLKMASRQTNKSSFNLGQSVLNLLKNIPKSRFKTIKPKMSKIPDQSGLLKNGKYKPWQIYFCFTAMTEQGINFNECMNELQTLETCLKDFREQSNNATYEFEVKPWTKAIRQLSDCKIQDKHGKVEVSCKSFKRMPKKIKRKTRYVFEKLLDKKISAGSPLHRAVDDLGETLSKTERGRRFVDELCQYASIYESGQKKVKKSLKLAKKNKKAMKRYKEDLKALETYKKGILRRSFGTMKRLHRSAVDFEKFFAMGMKDTFNEAWQGHVNVLTSLMGWMTKLLDLHASGESSPVTPGIPSDPASGDSNDDDDSNPNSVQMYARSKSEMARDVDDSMNVLMKSMNSLSKRRGIEEKNMLAFLADDLLLVSMVMQTISFVSSLFCSDYTAYEETTQASDEWVNPFEQ
ncbi:uncharacterized protein LOC108632842 [Ceratina calcarata]|uniref:Uncharacterized protein LOC108632842 n=1 Tax=Ceratina calcarata TaxID=156304 RepID=A0AAJ7W827_9HYME|nr:uncharacterized protein LOC108632842 [Ceratina calcarata]